MQIRCVYIVNYPLIIFIILSATKMIFLVLPLRYLVRDSSAWTRVRSSCSQIPAWTVSVPLILPLIWIGKLMGFIVILLVSAIGQEEKAISSVCPVCFQSCCASIGANGARSWAIYHRCSASMACVS